MAEMLVCWKCGASIAQLPLPLSRRAECPSCHAELHVRRMCAFYDPQAAKQCREPVAEDVHDKERANFCGYLVAKPGAYRPKNDATALAARAALEALFGDGGKKQ
jgi:hypothetical protein